MSRIFITGDTHGNYDKQKLNLHEFPESKHLTKDDYVIIAGDAAILWSSFSPTCPNRISAKDRKLINWYNSRNFTTLFIDGNHENHSALNSLPVTIWNGGKVHKISDSIYHLMRGQVYTIDNKKFFTMGGADSIDKHFRTENISWWKDEMPSNIEYEEAMKNLETNDMTVDYVITHCCGTSYLNDLFTAHFNADPLTQFFNRLEFNFGLQFKHWYFGHHHIDKKIDDKHTCLYYRIEEIKE